MQSRFQIWFPFGRAGREERWEREKGNWKENEYEEETRGKRNGERWGGKIGSNTEMGTAKNREREKEESVVNVGQRLTIENERDKEDSISRT